MKISVLGNTEHDTWFAKRLLAQGIDVDNANPLELPVEAEMTSAPFCGLLADDILIDTGPGSFIARHQLAERCRRQDLGYAEMAGPWQPMGQNFGFILFIGASAETVDTLTPLFDALAPQPGAWLPCGFAASGRFAAQVFDALAMAFALASQAGWATPGQTPQPLDWGAFFLEQRKLSDKLLDLARHYLSLCPESTPIETDPWQLLSAFSQPPRRQTRFSVNLARLIVLALTHSETQQEIFTTLMQGPMATPNVQGHDDR